MKVKFVLDRDLPSGKRVAAGETVRVSDADGEAYILCGVAEAVPKPKTKKEVNQDG